MAHVARPHKNAVPLAVTHEAWLVVFGLMVTVGLLRTDLISQLAYYAVEYSTIVSFIVGTFFTSVLTTTPAIVAIAELAQYIEPWKIAVVGGLGAVMGDLLIFRFVRSPLATYIVDSASNKTMLRIGRWISHSPFWWTIPALGALIIASPLPDELGLIMMGLSTIRMWTFLPLAYVMNTIGIFLIATAAQTAHIVQFVN